MPGSPVLNTCSGMKYVTLKQQQFLLLQKAWYISTRNMVNGLASLKSWKKRIAALATL